MGMNRERGEFRGNAHLCRATNTSDPSSSPEPQAYWNAGCHDGRESHGGTQGVMGEGRVIGERWVSWVKGESWGNAGCHWGTKGVMG